MFARGAWWRSIEGCVAAWRDACDRNWWRTTEQWFLFTKTGKSSWRCGLVLSSRIIDLVVCWFVYYTYIAEAKGKRGGKVSDPRNTPSRALSSVWNDRFVAACVCVKSTMRTQVMPQVGCYRAIYRTQHKNGKGKRNVRAQRAIMHPRLVRGDDRAKPANSAHAGRCELIECDSLPSGISTPVVTRSTPVTYTELICN